MFEVLLTDEVINEINKIQEMIPNLVLKEKS